MPKQPLVLAALLVCLAALPGCAGEDRRGGESSAPAASRQVESQAGPGEQEPERQESEAAQPEPETAPDGDEALIREILLDYGAVFEAPDEDRMKTQVVSLYYAGEWTGPEELPAGAYYSWFLTTVWAEDLSDRELQERYMLPGRDGWVFPQDVYEARITGRFDVGVDYLRADETLYHAQDNAYWLEAGGGVGMRPFVELQSARWEDPLLLLTVELDYAEEYAAGETWTLTVRLEEGGGWKYQSWVRQD